MIFYKYIPTLVIKFRIIIASLLSIFSLFFAYNNISYARDNSYTKERAVNNIDILSSSFKIKDVYVNNKLYKLSYKNPIIIKFDENSFYITGSCNSLVGNYTLENGIFTSNELISSKKLCNKTNMKDEELIKNVLISKPYISIQDLKNKESASKPSIILKLSSKYSPLGKKGETTIKLVFNERYSYPDTPLGDEKSTQLVKNICNQLIKNKSSENEGKLLAEKNSLFYRVYSRDGVDFPVTADYRVNRLNVKILNNQIIECTNG